MPNKLYDATKFLQQDRTCCNRHKRKILDMGNGMRVRPEEVNHTASLWWNGFVHFGTGSSDLIAETATFC